MRCLCHGGDSEWWCVRSVGTCGWCGCDVNGWYMQCICVMCIVGVMYVWCRV